MAKRPGTGFPRRAAGYLLIFALSFFGGAFALSQLLPYHGTEGVAVKYQALASLRDEVTTLFLGGSPALHGFVPEEFDRAFIEFTGATESSVSFSYNFALPSMHFFELRYHLSRISRLGITNLKYVVVSLDGLRSLWFYDVVQKSGGRNQSTNRRALYWHDVSNTIRLVELFLHGGMDDESWRAFKEAMMISGVPVEVPRAEDLRSRSGRLREIVEHVRQFLDSQVNKGLLVDESGLTLLPRVNPRGVPDPRGFVPVKARPGLRALWLAQYTHVQALPTEELTSPTILEFAREISERIHRLGARAVLVCPPFERMVPGQDWIRRSGFDRVINFRERNDAKRWLTPEVYYDFVHPSPEGAWLLSRELARRLTSEEAR